MSSIRRAEPYPIRIRSSSRNGDASDPAQASSARRTPWRSTRRAGCHRIQIFDQDGKLLDTYHQFSRISGLFINPRDMLYAIDSESNPTNHPGWKTGIRIGRASEDNVTAFIPPHPSNRGPQGVAGEGVAVDRDGNVYAAEGPISRADAGGGLTKYAKQQTSSQ